MTHYFAVRRVRGAAWNPAVPMREQALWAEHARFMNALAKEGFVVLGGLLGDGEDDVLLVIDAASEADVRTRLAADPWSTAGLLAIARVDPWTVLLDSRVTGR